MASCLVAGALLEFIFNADSSEEGSRGIGGSKRHVTARERFAGQNMRGAWMGCGAVLAAAAAGWYFFLPLTYGYPGLTVDQILMRKWLGYDLHFAK